MYNLTNTTLAQAEPLKIIGIALLVIVLLGAFVFLLLFLKFFRLWLQAKLSGADVKFSELIRTWLRKKGPYKDNSSEQNNRGSGSSDANNKRP